MQGTTYPNIHDVIPARVITNYLADIFEGDAVAKECGRS